MYRTPFRFDNLSVHEHLHGQHPGTAEAPWWELQGRMQQGGLETRVLASENGDGNDVATTTAVIAAEWEAALQCHGGVHD